MNANSLALDLDRSLVEVELLSEDELASIDGGSMLAPALMLLGAAAGACILGVIVGIGIYAVTN